MKQSRYGGIVLITAFNVRLHHRHRGEHECLPPGAGCDRGGAVNLDTTMATVKLIKAPKDSG